MNVGSMDTIIGLFATKHDVNSMASFDEKDVVRVTDLGLKGIEGPEEVL